MPTRITSSSIKKCLNSVLLKELGVQTNGSWFYPKDIDSVKLYKTMGCPDFKDKKEEDTAKRTADKWLRRKINSLIQTNKIESKKVHHNIKVNMYRVINQPPK